MKKHLILAISLIFTVGICCVLVFSYNIDKLTYDDTVEYSASVVEIEKIDTRNNMTIRLYIDNYLSYVIISPKLITEVNLQFLENIHKNDKIVFRIERKKDIHINNVDFLDIVYLANDDGVIISLEDYNNCTKESATKMRVAGIAFLILINSFTFLFLKKMDKTGDGSKPLRK